MTKQKDNSKEKRLWWEDKFDKELELKEFIKKDNSSMEERLVKEFNPSDTNNSVLGKYVMEFADYITGRTTKNTNKLADKRVNDWLIVFIKKEREDVERETIERIKKIINKPEKLDHICKCENKHFLSFERKDFDKMWDIITNLKG